MRRLWPLLAVPVAAIALVALVGVLRRDSVSATPGQVVEDFLRRLVGERYAKAAPYLGGSGSVSEAELVRWKENVENGLGEVRRVGGETEWISGEEADATGILVGPQRERRLRFALERENGHWRITRLDEFWGGPESEQGSADAPQIRERWWLRARPAGNR